MRHKKRIQNLVAYKHLRKTLRNNPTNAESFLWSKIKNNFLDFKFRRQHGIGDYIVDFYCSEIKLVIELDGEVHEYKYESDIKRDNFLVEQGIKILRYRNEEVMKNIEGILDDIKNNCLKIRNNQTFTINHP